MIVIENLNSQNRCSIAYFGLKYCQFQWLIIVGRLSIVWPFNRDADNVSDKSGVDPRAHVFQFLAVCCASLCMGKLDLCTKEAFLLTDIMR